MCVMGLPWLRSVTESPHVSTGIQSYSEHFSLLIESSRGRSDGVNLYIICIAMARRVKCDAVLKGRLAECVHSRPPHRPINHLPKHSNSLVKKQASNFSNRPCLFLCDFHLISHFLFASQIGIEL